MLELDEYRFLDGWSADRKKGSTRKDRVPLSILGEIDIGCAREYKKLLPAGLPCIFSVSDFMRCAPANRTLAQRAVNIMCSAGAIERTGKKGRAFLYGQKRITAEDISK
jgi:hypothetical protein